MAAVAEQTLARHKAVTPVDVCVGIGWLSGSHVEAWRQGRAGSLREFLPVDDARLTHFLDCLSRWAQASGLEPAEADYVSATRDRRPLRVTAAENADTERAWRTADLDHLVFLAAGDAALTRRAKKASTLSAVVVRWSRTRKRYERQGILIEEAALEAAEQACLADEDARMRRRERDRVPRDEARDRIRPAIDRILAAWA